MNNIIGNRIKESRKRAGYPTQESLALALRTHYGFKTDRPMVSKWESGYQTPEMYTIKCIAELCGVSTDYLCGKEKEPLTVSDEGLDEVISIFQKLSPDNRAKLIELSRLYLDAQSKSGER